MMCGSSLGMINVTLRSHTFYEILYCRSGSIQYLLGPDWFHIGRGDIVIIPPGVSHRPPLDRILAYIERGRRQFGDGRPHRGIQ